MSTRAPLYMIRADVCVEEFHRWMGSKRLRDPDHAMHCLLTECFGPPAPEGPTPKPFRLILPRDGPRGVFYGYGPADAAALREMGRICADPLQASVLPVESLDSKPMPVEWRTGTRLGFETRVRPTRRLNRPRNDKGETHVAERDAYLMQALDPQTETRKREEVYVAWLSEQFERRSGARLDPQETRLVSFRRTPALRKRYGRASEGPDAVMRGTLTITDADAFTALLARGIGRHHAYGYGMVLLRPTGKAL